MFWNNREDKLEKTINETYDLCQKVFKIQDEQIMGMQEEINVCKQVANLVDALSGKFVEIVAQQEKLDQKFKDFEQFVFVALSQEQNKRIGLGAKLIEMQGILNNKPIETDQAFEIAMHCDNNSLELPIKNKPSEKKKRSPEECYELPKELKT